MQSHETLAGFQRVNTDLRGSVDTIRSQVSGQLGQVTEQLDAQIRQVKDVSASYSALITQFITDPRHEQARRELQGITERFNTEFTRLETVQRQAQEQQNQLLQLRTQFAQVQAELVVNTQQLASVRSEIAEERAHLTTERQALGQVRQGFQQTLAQQVTHAREINGAVSDLVEVAAAVSPQRAQSLQSLRRNHVQSPASLRALNFGPLQPGEQPAVLATEIC